jgi:hypothetical protein
MTLRSHLLLVLTLVCLSLRATAFEPQHCAASLEGLGRLTSDSPLPLRWEETSMTDGKPLIVSILEKDGSLFLVFMKTREGLWAEGAAVICKTHAGIEAHISQLRMGPAAHWILRLSAGQGRTFAISRQSTGQLLITTPGWNGVFLPTQK